MGARALVVRLDRQVDQQRARLLAAKAFDGGAVNTDLEGAERPKVEHRDRLPQGPAPVVRRRLRAA